MSKDKNKKFDELIDKLQDYALAAMNKEKSKLEQCRKAIALIERAKELKDKV